MNNPFSVKTPETLNHADIASLFIDVFSDFPKLRNLEHTFIHGPRGSGKSMMLRYMEPQVQLAANKVDTAAQLDNFAIHVPIKNSRYNNPEMERFEGSSYYLLSEHKLIISITIKVLDSLKELLGSSNDHNEELCAFGNEFIENIIECGVETDLHFSNFSGVDVLNALLKLCKSVDKKITRYVRKHAFCAQSPYSDSILDYEDFFLTSVAMIKGLSFSPNGPLLLMMDDADNLPERMQLVLNSWVSYRTTDRLCLKISTQQKYKTWRTKQGILIENPHDFSEIDISSVYTSKSSSLYYDRVYAIVKRRLELSGLTNISPTDFFPSNTSQDERLEEVKKRIGESWDSGKKVSSRKNDDILRYATSEYMKELASAKKQNTFSYAGFNSLVNLSSGMIRNFLDPAATMYAYESSKSGANEILSIPHEVQQTIIREWSESYILNEIGRADQDTGLGSKSHKLKNLISGIGMLFQKKLVSNDSERRYISFMLSNETEKDDQDVLNLGVELGVLQKSTIARKEGFGRNFVYILNRRLAPFYKIDPAGYAAHMSITPEHLRQAMQEPKEFVKTRLKENNNDSPQISIFEEDAS